MTQAEKNRYFFVHVMKTGGTSFTEILRSNFTPDQRYPDACMTEEAGFWERIEAYLHVPKLVASVNANDNQLRIVLGHIPYAVRSLLHQDYQAMTLLRHPVDRTISYLRHCRRYHNEHMPLALEEIYEDEWFQASFMRNYQTKIFSMSAQEALAENRLPNGAYILPSRQELGDGSNTPPELESLREKSPGRYALEYFAASTGVIQIDDSRLAVAKENLSATEVVGVTEHYDLFLKKLVDRYGWKIDSIPHRHTGETDTVSKALRKRIAQDNPYDLELYEYARSLSV